MDQAVKYYVYVSTAKLDALYPQLPRSLWEKLFGNLTWGAKVAVPAVPGPEINVQLAHHEQTQSDRLRRVLQYLTEQGWVGTIDAPRQYFAGTLDMRWGPLDGGESPVVFFGGATEQTIVGLGGSARHVIGAVGTSPAESPASLGPYILDAINQELAQRPYLTDALAAEVDHPELAQSPAVHAGSASSPSADEYQVWVSIPLMVRDMLGPKYRLEFVAKTLLDGSAPFPLVNEHQSRVLLGTPIYVADATGG